MATNTFRDQYIAACKLKAEFEAMAFCDSHGSIGATCVPSDSLMGKQQVAGRFGISISKFDGDRRKNRNGNRDIHLDPIPNMGRRVLFHPEKVEAELDRWKKRRLRE